MQRIIERKKIPVKKALKENISEIVEKNILHCNPRGIKKIMQRTIERKKSCKEEKRALKENISKIEKKTLTLHSCLSV